MCSSISPDKPASIDYVDTLADPWMISQVTAMELLVGARDKREVAYLDAFLSSYPIVPLNAPIGKKAYELLLRYAKSHGLHVFDSLVWFEAALLAVTWEAVGRRYKTYYRAVFRSYRVLVLDPPPTLVAQHQGAGSP